MGGIRYTYTYKVTHIVCYNFLTVPETSILSTGTIIPGHHAFSDCKPPAVVAFRI